MNLTPLNLAKKSTDFYLNESENHFGIVTTQSELYKALKLTLQNESLEYQERDEMKDGEENILYSLDIKKEDIDVPEEFVSALSMWAKLNKLKIHITL